MNTVFKEKFKIYSFGFVYGIYYKLYLTIYKG